MTPTNPPDRHTATGRAARPLARASGAVERALLALAILSGAALRMYQLGLKGFWGDEIWTAERSQWGVAEIVNFSLDHTVGPWTYLAGRAALTLLGMQWQEFVLRWPSVIGGVLAIPLVWALAHRLWRRWAGLAAAALLAVSPYQIWYGQEARYYTWLVLFSLASTYFLYRAFEEPRRTAWWAGFAVATALNVYNHPLSALLAAAGQLPFCLLYVWRSPHRQARVAGLIGSAAAIGLAILPLVLRTAQTGQLNTQEAGAVISPTLEDWLRALIDILYSLVERFGAAGPARWLFLALAVMGVVALARARQWKQLTLLAAPLIVVPLLFAVTKFPFILRYVLFLQPLYLLLAARGIMALAEISLLRGRRAPAALAGATLALALLTSLATAATAYTQAKPVDWRSLAVYLQAHGQPEDMIVARYGWAGAALRWYFAPTFRYTLFDQADPDAAALTSGVKRVWLIQPVEQPIDPANSEDPMTLLDLVPVEDWQDARFDDRGTFYPISELPARLYVAQTTASWVQFGEIPQPNWTDRAYSEVEPDKPLQFALALPGDSPRELWITYFDYPRKELRVSVDGAIAAEIGGVGNEWRTARIPLPAGAGDIVHVVVEVAGAEAGGVSYAELRPAAP